VAETAQQKKGRVLSGMRPTGRLHIGHYFGALQNWIRMQEEYDCFFFVADWHALTTDYADASAVAQNTIDIATDWLAAGLDPAKCTMFVQSQVPEHSELHLLLSMVTPLGWLERVPTYKEQLENIKDKDLHTYGFLGYPVLQCADIVIYSKESEPLFVPVGEDQVSHVELSREIVRRFHAFYGLDIDHQIFLQKNNTAFRDATGPFAQLGATYRISYPMSEAAGMYWIGRLREKALADGLENFLERLDSARPFFRRMKVLAEPSHLLTETPRIPGTDGRKMSKSYGNFVSLGESDESIRAKAKVMMTDPARKRRADKGNPDVCPVFSWHKLFSTKETIAWADQGCRTAGIGCIECKEAMADHLIQWIEPIRERRLQYETLEKENGEVRRILVEGAERARKTAQETMKRVRGAVFGKDKILQGSAGTSAVKDVKAGR